MKPDCSILALHYTLYILYIEVQRSGIQGQVIVVCNAWITRKTCIRCGHDYACLCIRVVFFLVCVVGCGFEGEKKVLLLSIFRVALFW